MATLTHILNHSIVHPACLRTAASCARSRTQAAVYRCRTRAKRCRQYAFTVDFGAPFDAHNFSTHSSNISRARGPHLPHVSTTNGTNTVSAGTTASYFRIFSDSRNFAAHSGFGSPLPRIKLWVHG